MLPAITFRCRALPACPSENSEGSTLEKENKPSAVFREWTPGDGWRVGVPAWRRRILTLLLETYKRQPLSVVSASGPGYSGAEVARRHYGHSERTQEQARGSSELKRERVYYTCVYLSVFGSIRLSACLPVCLSVFIVWRSPQTSHRRRRRRRRRRLPLPLRRSWTLRQSSPACPRGHHAKGSP